MPPPPPVAEGFIDWESDVATSEWTILLPETGQHQIGAELAAIASMRWPALTVHANGAVSYTWRESLIFRRCP